MGKHLIFVYGTLKRGWGNNAILTGQQFLGTARAGAAAYQMYSLGGYPGVIAWIYIYQGSIHGKEPINEWVH